MLTTAVAAGAVLITLQGSSARRSAVDPEPVLATPVATIAQAPPDFRPPTRTDAADALVRAFSGTLQLDATRAEALVAGDFNGDQSPDLIAPVRPIEARLDDLNDTLTANWLVQDPAITPVPRTPRDPVVVAKHDRLLAVVHGYGPSGWRARAARQAYLLTGGPDGSIEVRTWQSLVAQAAHAQRRLELPQLRGDLVYDGTGQRFLYFAGFRYAWQTIAP